MSVPELGDCLHEGDHWCTEKPDRPQPPDPRGFRVRLKETTAVCPKCELLLYSVEMFDDLSFERTYHNETYRLLYTRAGRKELLVALMTDAGLAIPQAWETPRDWSR